MQFSTSFILAALPFLAAAAPAASDYKSSPLPVSSGPVGLIATHSASPIHLQPINASGQAFWLGKDTSTYCPLTPKSSCPPGTDTRIEIFGNEAHPGTASMSTVVPGGQQIYIRPNGALSYTQAHSAFKPTGSIDIGFTYTPGPNFGHFGVNLPGAAGFLACPVGPQGPEGGVVYQVFVNIKGLKDSDVAGGKISKCIGLNAIAAKADGVGAWQYT